MRKSKAQLQAEKDLDWLTADPRGRRVLARLFADAGLLPPVGGPLDHASLAFREGRKSLTQPIFAALVSAWPDRLTALLTEQQQDSAAHATGPDANSDPDDPAE